MTEQMIGYGYMRDKYVRIVTLGFIQRGYVGNTTAVRKSLGFVIEYISSKVLFVGEVFSRGIITAGFHYFCFFVPSALGKTTCFEGEPLIWWCNHRR